VSQTPGAQDGSAASVACLCRHSMFFWPDERSCSHVPHHDDKQHAALSEPHHMTHWSHGRCDGAIPLLDSAFAQLPMPRADLPARLGDNLRVTRQSYEQRLVKGNGELISPQRKWQHLFLEKPGSLRESQPRSPLCSEYSTQVFRTMGKHSASTGWQTESVNKHPAGPARRLFPVLATWSIRSNILPFPR
jgi:hypothetical protein